MTLSLIAILFSLVLFIIVPVGLFFVIRYLIRYNAAQKKMKSQQQEEIEKMNIEDL